MKLKPGVKFGNPVMAICFASQVAESVFTKYNYGYIITSVNDGKHSEGSKHYTNEAIDIRTKHLPDDGVLKKQVASEIKEALGEDFDVILESLGGQSEHIHCEYDPK